MRSVHVLILSVPERALSLLFLWSHWPGWTKTHVLCFLSSFLPLCFPKQQNSKGIVYNGTEPSAGYRGRREGAGQPSKGSSLSIGCPAFYFPWILNLQSLFLWPVLSPKSNSGVLAGDSGANQSSVRQTHFTTIIERASQQACSNMPLLQPYHQMLTTATRYDTLTSRTKASLVDIYFSFSVSRSPVLVLRNLPAILLWEPSLSPRLWLWPACFVLAYSAKSGRVWRLPCNKKSGARSL